MNIGHRGWRGLFALAVMGMCGASHSARAQAQASSALTTELESRASLEVEAKRAEAAHRTQEAWLLRTRLQKGDFQDGDRIIIKLLGSVTFPMDTFQVRAGKMLPLPQMSDMPLEGVLRSELEPRLSHHLAKFLLDSAVRATPLLRMAVFGQVRNPGYFYVQADVLLNDLVMRAGGPNPLADMDNMVIRRGTDVIWPAQDTRTALADGMSLDRLHLRAGDELFVDDVRGSIDWRTVATWAGPALGIITVLFRVVH